MEYFIYKYVCKVYHEVLMNGFYLFPIILTVTKKVKPEVFPRGSIEKNSNLGKLNLSVFFLVDKRA